METVYVDSLFALNAVIDYFLLLCAARLCGAVLRRWRFAAAAVLGGVYACLALLPGLEFLSAGAVKLCLAAAMSLIAYGGEARLGRLTVAFLAVSAAFGGAVWAASMLSGGGLTGRIYVPVSGRVLLLSFAVCYAAVSFVFRRIGTKNQREIVDITISFRDKSVSLRALRDTGNELYDPIGGRKVLVAEAAAILPLLPEGAAECISGDAAETVRRLSALPGLCGRASLVPYRTVDGRGSLLPALRPDEVLVNGERKEALAAIRPGALCDNGEYAAII